MAKLFLGKCNEYTFFLMGEKLPLKKRPSAAQTGERRDRRAG